MSGKTAFLYNDFTVVLSIGGIVFHVEQVECRGEAIALAMRWERGIE